jgi:hypothetical protein
MDTIAGYLPPNAYVSPYNLTINPANNVVVMSQNYSYAGAIPLDTVEKIPGNSDFWAPHAATLTLMGFVTKWKDSTADGSANHYLFNDYATTSTSNFKYMIFIMPRNMGGKARGFGFGNATNVVNFSYCVLDSMQTNAIAGTGATTFNHCFLLHMPWIFDKNSVITNSIFFKQNATNGSTVAGNNVNFTGNFILDDSSASYSISYVTAPLCTNAVFNNNYVFRNNNENIVLDHVHAGKFKNNVFQNIGGGSCICSHGTAILDSNLSRCIILNCVWRDVCS